MMLHTDISGPDDLKPPEEMRIYYMAGTQHTRGILPLTLTNPLDGSSGTIHSMSLITRRCCAPPS